jgi:hypothetical protein
VEDATHSSGETRIPLDLTHQYGEEAPSGSPQIGQTCHGSPGLLHQPLLLRLGHRSSAESENPRCSRSPSVADLGSSSMEASAELTARQLSRMRGMTALYHRRFFFDVNLTTVLVVGLFVVGWAGVEQAFLLVPVVALIGAIQTAFDSSYLTFARWYAMFL